GARSWSTAASSCRAAERSCWPTPKYAAPTSAPERGRGVIAGAPPRQGFSYTQTGGSPRTAGAPEAGAKVFWLDSPFAPRAVLLHLDRESPASKPGFFSNRRSTRAGCEGVLAWRPFRTEAVRLHLDRDSATSKTGFSSNGSSTRPGCEGFGSGAALVRRRAVVPPVDR